MKKTHSLAILLLGLCVAFLITGCAQNQNTSAQLIGTRSGGGTAQVFTNPTLPMPAPPLKSSETQGNQWGAIVYADDIAALDGLDSPFLWGIGIVKNYATAEEAQQAAMATCEADGISGCQVRATFQGQCLALAYAPQNRAFAWTIEATEELAKQKVERVCAQYAQGQTCKVMTTECPALAGTPSEQPLAITQPELVAKFSHDLAVFALRSATLRDQGTSYEQAVQQHKDVGTFINEVQLNQLKLVYGPLKNYPPEQIYRMVMFSYLYEFSH